MSQNSLQFVCRIFVAAASLTLVGLPHEVRADDDSSQTNKWQFNLFNRTPADQLRPLALDANDNVVDPTTVDAGQVLVQGSLVDYYSQGPTYRYYPGAAVTDTHQFIWSPQITVGLLNNVDFFVQPSFYHQSYNGNFHVGTNAISFSGHTKGYSGISVGTKINLWGNDGGTTAFSVSPMISLPNDDGGSPVQGGANISFSVRLPYQFYLKVMTAPYTFNDEQNEIAVGLENSMSVHKTFNKLDTYAYLNTDWQRESPWSGYAGIGLAYLITDNLQIFTGIGFGLTDNSYDYNPRFGLGWRF